MISSPLTDEAKYEYATSNRVPTTYVETVYQANDAGQGVEELGHCQLNLGNAPSVHVVVRINSLNVPRPSFQQNNALVGQITDDGKRGGQMLDIRENWHGRPRVVRLTRTHTTENKEVYGR